MSTEIILAAIIIVCLIINCIIGTILLVILRKLERKEVKNMSFKKEKDMIEEPCFYVRFNIHCLPQIILALASRYVQITMINDQPTAIITRECYESENFHFSVVSNLLLSVIEELDRQGIENIFIENNGSDFSVILSFDELKEHFSPEK